MKTAVYNVLDIRAIATLHKHYIRQGLNIKSVSSLTRQSIEGLTEMLVLQKGADKFLSTTDAINYLESHNIMSPIRTRGQQPLIKAMQSESLELDGLNKDYIQKKAQANIDPDQYEAAKRILNERKEGDLSGAILGKTPNTIKEDKEDEKDSSNRQG